MKTVCGDTSRVLWLKDIAWMRRLRKPIETANLAVVSVSDINSVTSMGLQNRLRIIQKTQLIDLGFKLLGLEQLVRECGKHKVKVIRDLAVLKSFRLTED